MIFRLWDLDLKPPHFDEGINGWFVAQMWEQGFYRYDPTNFHGPLYFYVLQVAELLLGRGIFAFRFVTVLISTATLGLVLMHAHFVGRIVYGALLILALSPAMVFYSRYAIHESLLIFSQVLFSYGFLWWQMERNRNAIIAMAAAVVVAVTTKETFFIFFGTWFIAWGLNLVFERIAPSAALVSGAEPAADGGGTRALVDHAHPEKRLSAKFLLAVFAISALVTIALFSGFFMNLKGIRDMVIAFSPWLKTGVGNTGHEKPFFYWLKLLSLYEWPVLLTLLGIPFYALKVGRWFRIYAAVGIGLLLAYSIIPYKTPWCIIGIIWPLAFAFGYLAREMKQMMDGRWRMALKTVIAATFTVTFFKMLTLNFKNYAEANEPYVYVQSTKDLSKMWGLLNRKVDTHPEDKNMPIYILHKESWPLPWMLGDFPGAKFGGAAAMTDMNADILLVDAADQEFVEKRITRRFFRMPFKLRDAYQDGFAYFDHEKFKGIMLPEIPVIEKSVADSTLQLED